MVDHPPHNPDGPATNWALNPWIPMSKPIDVKHLGKLAEELAEAAEVLNTAASACSRASAAVARCLIQGIDELEPVTQAPNKEWLENELADVAANSLLVQKHFKLDVQRMTSRTVQKLRHLRRWHSMLSE